jgi:hypothetical protein
MDETCTIELYSVRGLVDLVPGSTRKVWLGNWIPMLTSAGVLRKRGRGWVGRRHEIEAALLGGK